jgi:hypothetical protein
MLYTLRIHGLWLFGLLVLGLHAPGAAAAQVGKDARITTRSDVKMSIEGGIGTGGTRLEALAKHLGGPLGSVKECYAEIVKVDPSVTGTLEVDLSLAKGRRLAQVELVGQERLNNKMRKCVQGAFSKVTGDDVPRPAKARVILELTNSAASSVDEVREHEEEASRVDAVDRGDGKFEAQSTSTQGEIFYTTIGRPKEVVEQVHAKVRDTLPALFDCRRRAGKRGSPEGELTLRAALHKQGKVVVDVKQNTVQAERAPFCVTRALSQGLRGVATANVELVIRFAP